MLFLTTLQQVAILLIFIFIGYFFRKKGIINEQGRKVLAGLLVNLFAPAYSVISLSTVVNVQNVTEYAALLLVGVGVAFAVVFLAFPFARAMGKDKFHVNLYKYAFAFGNIGYFGYPLVYGVFGAVARAQMMVFCLPTSIAIYSYGYYVLTRPVNELPLDQAQANKQSFAKKISYLYNPPMIGAYLGIALGLLTSGFNFTIPKFIEDLFTIAGNCQSAPAMLITGAVLAGVPFKQLFTSLKPYVVGVIRLLVYPLVFGALFAILYLLGWRDQTFMKIAFIVIISVGMPVGMNVIVYPESAGMDSTEGAKTCFISYILALIALPIVYSLVVSILNVTF